MTKNIINKYILIFLMLSVSLSCTKLDLQPTDTINPDKAFRNLNDLGLGVIGAYAALDYNLIGSSVIVADEATYPNENTVGNNQSFRWLYTAENGSVTGAYYEYYIVIDRVNRVLANIDNIVTSGPEQVTKNQYLGELYALRAYCHFELLRGYASSYENGALGVPYMTQSLISYPARDPFERVIVNAKSDLALAKDLIPTTFVDRTRITKIGVSAIQARIALYEKNWSEAITYSTEVINAIPLATKAQFPGVWTDANNNEIVWKLKRAGTSDSKIGDFFFRQSGGIVLYAPAFKLINSFDQVNDIRYPAYIKFDATKTGIKSKYSVNKYIGGTAATPGLADIKLFRTAEMYLIRAEARAESSGDAAADLNTLRTARITGYLNAVFPDKAATITAIYNERFKELAFEGHRFFDLKRRNLPVERTVEDAANAAGAITMQPTQAQYSFPIPALEISVNKNTVQNPKY
jgi:hypothetical protein